MVETKEALQGDPKKTLGVLLTPAIVTSSVSEKGTCLGTHPAIRASRRANINAGLPEREARAESTPTGAAERLEGRLSTIGSQITHQESFE